MIEMTSKSTRVGTLTIRDKHGNVKYTEKIDFSEVEHGKSDEHR